MQLRQDLSPRMDEGAERVPWVEGSRTRNSTHAPVYHQPCVPFLD
jgi:hypothetical protein